MKKYFNSNLRYIFRAITYCVFVSTLVFGVGLANAASFSMGDWSIEYERNYPLGAPNESLTHAVIVIHGTDRNADDYYARMATAAKAAGQFENTLIIAPRFQTNDDMPSASHLYWSGGGWKIGYKAVNGSRASSFTVVDHIMKLIDERFPAIQTLTVIGHSAGGQFVQRFAAISEQQNVFSRPISVRYIVANPSSYAYINAQRPYSTGGCPEYNDYKYGLSNIDTALAYTQLSAAAATEQLLARDVVILLGQNDNDESNATLSKTCGAMAQGKQRLERGHSYFRHIKAAKPASPHYLQVVPGVGHSSSGIFNSTIAKDEIFLFAEPHKQRRIERAFNAFEAQYMQLQNGSELKQKQYNNRPTYCKRYEENQAQVSLWADGYFWLKLEGMDWQRASEQPAWL